MFGQKRSSSNLSFDPLPNFTIRLNVCAAAKVAQLCALACGGRKERASAIFLFNHCGACSFKLYLLPTQRKPGRGKIMREAILEHEVRKIISVRFYIFFKQSFDASIKYNFISIYDFTNFLLSFSCQLSTVKSSICTLINYFTRSMPVNDI